MFKRAVRLAGSQQAAGQIVVDAGPPRVQFVQFGQVLARLEVVALRDVGLAQRQHNRQAALLFGYLFKCLNGLAGQPPRQRNALAVESQ